jgi:gas vesicle protein
MSLRFILGFLIGALVGASVAIALSSQPRMPAGMGDA